MRKVIGRRPEQTAARKVSDGRIRIQGQRFLDCYESFLLKLLLTRRKQKQFPNVCLGKLCVSGCKVRILRDGFLKSGDRGRVVLSRLAIKIEPSAQILIVSFGVDQRNAVRRLLPRQSFETDLFRQIASD